MRDPIRQKELLDLIYLIWKKYPDMRLGQLIGNCADNQDPYYLEDDELYKRLCEIYNV